MARQPMPISSRWLQGAVLTYLVGFTVLGVLAYLVYRDQPPIPERVVAGDEVLFTRDDIVGGMHVFQRYGWRYGETISTAFVESTVNQVVSMRMVKQQQMRWSPRGAHLLLQVRTRVLNEDLRTTFHRWYPTFDADPNGQETRHAV